MPSIALELYKVIPYRQPTFSADAALGPLLIKYYEMNELLCLLSYLVCVIWFYQKKSKNTRTNSNSTPFDRPRPLLTHWLRWEAVGPTSQVVPWRQHVLSPLPRDTRLLLIASTWSLETHTVDLHPSGTFDPCQVNTGQMSGRG